MGGLTFMGCTGRGMPNTAPVTTLKRPEKTSVEDRSTEPCRARAIISGSRVPRSPRAPEISATGDSRSVRRLYRLRRASSARTGSPILSCQLGCEMAWQCGQRRNGVWSCTG